MGAIPSGFLVCTHITSEQQEEVDGRYPQSDVLPTGSSSSARFVVDLVHMNKSHERVEVRRKLQAVDGRQTDMWPQQRNADPHSLEKEWTDGAQSVSSAIDIAESCQCTLYRMLASTPTLEIQRRAFNTGVKATAALAEPHGYCSVQDPYGQRCELHGIVGMTKISECFQPLMLEIAGYLVTSPRDYLRCFLWTSPTISASLTPFSQRLWKQMYTLKWLAFFDCLNFLGVLDWQSAFRDTLAGRVECTLEVFDREKKKGFAMGAMAAQVTFESNDKVFVARYLSASEVDPELIPVCEVHRLRFCPPSARLELQPCVYSEEDGVDTVIYPYRVLKGLDGLVVGKGVELQWKMQYGSPFGWWYGHLEDIQHDQPSRGLATASITFPHFQRDSMWYRMQVIVGDDQMRLCSFGGYTGGLRAVTDDEHKRWMHFFPKGRI